MESVSSTHRHEIPGERRLFWKAMDVGKERGGPDYPAQVAGHILVRPRRVEIVAIRFEPLNQVGHGLCRATPRAIRVDEQVTRNRRWWQTHISNVSTGCEIEDYR